MDTINYVLFSIRYIAFKSSKEFAIYMYTIFLKFTK